MAAGTEYQTVFGSLEGYTKGRVTIIDDDPKVYALSNVFDVAGKSEPYERVVVAKNLQYVIETARAEGTSPWYTAAHDETVICLQGEVELSLIKPSQVFLDAEAEGAHLLNETPVGQKMGRIVLRRGHQALLPANAAYKFDARLQGVLLIQSLLGPVSVEKWAKTCQTEA